MKFKELVKKRKYEIITFIVFLCLIPPYYRMNGGVRRVAYAQYLADIKLGFNSHTFIGTFLNLFGSTVSPLKINILGTVMSVITALLAALVMGNIVRAFQKQKFNTAFSMFFAAAAYFAPFGVVFAYVLYGLVDIFWVACVFGSLLCLKKQWTRWFIPILTFIGVWIHYGYALAFVPFITLILLYDCGEKKHRANNISLALTNSVTAYGFVAYCVFFAKKFVRMTSTQAMQYLDNKFTDKFAYYDKNYIMAFFYNVKQNGNKGTGDLDILSGLFSFVKNYALKHYEPIVFYILIIPAVVCCVILSVKLFKAVKDNGFMRFIRLASIGIFIASAFAALISSDYYRFAAEAFTSYNLFITYLAVREDKAFLAVRDEFYDKWKNKRYIIFIYILCFAMLCAAALFQ